MLVSLILSLTISTAPTALDVWRARHAAMPQVRSAMLTPWPMRALHAGTCTQVIVSDGEGGMHPRLVCERVR